MKKHVFMISNTKFKSKIHIPNCILSFPNPLTKTKNLLSINFPKRIDVPNLQTEDQRRDRNNTFSLWFDFECDPNNPLISRDLTLPLP